MKNFRFPKLEASFLVWSILYLALTILTHWRLHFDLIVLLYVFGAIIGMFVLDVMENIIDTDPSPLRGVLAQMILLVLTVFSLTSTGNFLGKGVVLFLNLKFLYLARQEYLQTGNLVNWFKQMNIMITPKRSEIYLFGFTGVFLAATLLFILV